MTLACLKSGSSEREMLSHYKGAWFGLRQDEEGIVSLVIACSQACAEKLLDT